MRSRCWPPGGSRGADREAAQLKHWRLDELRRQVRLNGFRPGKVPLTVVRQRYGAQVRQEVLQE
ncbi:MAG: trigger factor, partial [Acidimicrobiia bacterium]